MPEENQPKPKRDWPAIRQEYQTTDISQRELGKKYGIPRSTIELRARTEGWFQPKKVLENTIREITIASKQETKQACLDQLQPFIEKKKAQITKLGYSVAERGIRRINKLYSQSRPTMAKAEAEAARAVESLVRTARTSLGMNDGSALGGVVQIGNLISQSQVAFIPEKPAA